MEDINKFLGGINSDVHPSSQPEHTMRSALNFVPLAQDGNLYSITNEDGTSLVDRVTFPDGFQVIGYTTLNSEIIVVLATPSGFSQVGYIVEDDNPDATYGAYHPVAPVDGAGNVPENNGEFGFTVAHPVDCVARKLINGHRVLYFTDNNVPFGRVDLNDPPEVGDVADQVQLIFNQQIPEIEIKEIRENVAATIRPGVYQFITRYVTNNGGVTNFGIPSNPLPMVPPNREVGVDAYAGEFYENTTINKNVILEFSNIDQQYQELEIVAIFYEGSQSVFKASVVGQVPITGDTLEFTFTGPDGDAEIELTREELRKIAVSYTRAKCIEQKDNTLFLSNLSADRQADDELLQQIANNIEVSYRVQEVQFSGRGDNDVGETIAFVPAYAPYISGVNDVTLVMSSEIDPTSGNTAANYLLNKPGTAAQGQIQITDSSLIIDGDTFEVDTTTGGGGLTQLSVTFTARNTPTLTDEFQIVSGDDAATALNLVDAINNSPNVNDYFAQLSGADVILTWAVVDVDANGVSINLSGAGAAGVNFAGASVTPTTEVPNTAVVSGNEVVLAFPSPVSTSDTLQVVSDISNLDLSLTFQTGLNSDLPILSAQPDDGVGSVDTGFTDYVNEELTVTSKGYRRGEAYSLGFVLLFKDGTTSFTYHIPASADYVVGAGLNEPTGGDAWPAFSASPTSTGRCGTYVSANEYPLEQNYPGDQVGDDIPNAGPAGFERNVRHHYMPELANEPHFRVDASGITFIRILNLEFEFTQAIPQSILQNVSEIVFVRERRNTDQNKSIFAQGVVNRMVIMADDYDNDGKVQGTVINGGTLVNNGRAGYYGTEMPFFNNVEGVDFIGDVFEKSGARTNAGMVYPDFVNSAYGGTYNNGEKLSSDIVSNHGFFHSPETNLLSGFRFSADVAVAASLKPELHMTGEFERPNFKGDEWEYDSPGTKGIDYQTRYMYADYFGDYRNYVAAVSGNTLQIQQARYADPNKDRLSALDPAEPGIRTSTRWTQGGFEIVTNNPFSDPGGSKFRPFNNAQIRDVAGTGCVSDCEGVYLNTSGVVESSAELRRYLYNLRITNLTQYGQLGIGEYMPISRQSPFTGGGAFRTTYTGVFGGDTFITKYAFNTGNLVSYFPYKRDGDSAINRPNQSNSHVERAYANIDGVEKGGSTSGGPNKAHGWDFRACTYFFVESEINTNYRHRPAEETQQDYYPHQTNKNALLNSFLPYLGQVRAYNTQYSYENNVKVFFIKGSTQNVVTSFENRTIYSEQAAADDTLDAYRSFPQNNFYDLPANTGPIWDTFVEYNTLFMHTPKSLWRTFAEPAATLQGGNISDAVLGVGSLFARPSTEMLTTEGGYAGTISQFGGTHTQLGYIFPDVLQGKVFGLVMGNGGPYLKEFSQDGLQTFMHQALPVGLIINNSGELDFTNVTTANSHLLDNPYIGIGLCGGYDYKLRRAWIIKHPTYDGGGVVVDTGFALSYSAVTQHWMSFHSYQPNLIIPYDNRVFFLRNKDLAGADITAEMWEMNIGNKGEYFGTVYNSELEAVSAKDVLSSKVYQNFKLNSESRETPGGIKVRDDNFESVQVFNDRMNTGTYSLVHGNSFLPTKSAGETFIKFRNDEYRIAIPRDAVVDNSQDLFDPGNIDQSVQVAERIKGDYAQFKFVYNNTPNREFLLKYLSTIFNVNIR